ncbi:integrase core domain-containing protein, partial [Enterobacteriaceae bacterium H4N4]
WGDTTGTWTALELWLMRLGIRVGHSRPYHPQTQGKLERFHRSLKAEVLQGKWFTDSGELQRAFDHWRAVYNLERPHEALNMAVPA